MYGVAPFTVLAAAYDGSRSLYEGFYTIGRYGKRVYYPTWVAA
jgi:hypothetical protein